MPSRELAPAYLERSSAQLLSSVCMHACGRVRASLAHRSQLLVLSPALLGLCCCVLARPQPARGQLHQDSDAAAASAAPLPARAALRAQTPAGDETHTRLTTAHGVVHTWTPRGYDAQRAGVVLYVHGYHNDADGVFASVRAQFRQSGLQALFVVADAPGSKRDALRWTSLAALRAELAHAGISWPAGPTIAVGHSGGYRTLAAWATDPAVRTIILLDAMYGDPAPFRAFLAPEDPSNPRALVIVARGTAAAADGFVRGIPFATIRATVPQSEAALTAEERGSRLLYFRSQYGHRELAQNGKVLPLVLRLAATRTNVPPTEPPHSSSKEVAP